MEDKIVGTLYIVATPIGNLGDMTLRALETLKNVDLIACEDTRVTGNLLKHFDIQKPLISYFQHSKLSKIDQIIAHLQAGKNIALVTDAGTPGISDPGQALISKIRESLNIGSIENWKLAIGKLPCIPIVPIPGPSAVAAIASVSGLIEKEFFFAGFLPKKKGRQTKFKAFSALDCPIIIYESANRLARTMEDIRGYFGTNVEVFIGREMTKMFEEYWGGSIEQVITDLPRHPAKGEIALVVKKI